MTLRGGGLYNDRAVYGFGNVAAGDYTPPAAVPVDHVADTEPWRQVAARPELAAVDGPDPVAEARAHQAQPTLTKAERGDADYLRRTGQVG
jgi:hypothetical protein